MYCSTAAVLAAGSPRPSSFLSSDFRLAVPRRSRPSARRRAPRSTRRRAVGGPSPEHRRERLRRAGLAAALDDQLPAGGPDVAAAALAHRHRRPPSPPGCARSCRPWRPTGGRRGCPARRSAESGSPWPCTPSRSRASRRASAGVSFTPLSMTYSKVIRLRLASGKRRQASMMACRPYFALGGTIDARCSSVVAWSEIARFGISGSAASLSSIGTRPTVDSVTRFGRQRHAVGLVQQAAAPSSSRRSCAAARPCPSARC